MKFEVCCSAKEPVILGKRSILGHEYSLTSEYLLKDGRPYIYVMGELHFSRMNEKDWRSELEKMKDGGIEIVSSYLFWNHHEAEKGKFDFSGNRNLKKFVNLCAELGMPFFLRIGPWAHGEARGGGFPDWLRKECPEKRTLNEEYLFYVERYFRQIYEQVRDCRNIIGIQIENECSYEPDYMQYLYDKVREIGFDALLFTATGWDDAILPECLVPVFGAYPEYPWAQDTAPFSSTHTYGFYAHDADYFYEHNKRERRYPVFTCELGGGNQSTYHRRPLIMPHEVAALTLVQLGSGCKGLGYYMYHGGVNPVVTDSDRIVATFQESRESGYPNDCPVLSYDFQAPLGDFGQKRQSLYELKTLFDFVKSEEASLAGMQTFRPLDMPDKNDFAPLRACIQSDGESGFLFYINCFHGHRMPAKNETAHIQTRSGEISIPLSVPENGFGIIPFNLTVGSEKLRWVKAFPVCRSEKEIVFSLIKGTEPGFEDGNGRTGNLRDVKSIGGVGIRLTETECPAAGRGIPLQVCEDENRLSFDIFGHIIPLKGEKLPDLTREYVVDIPEGTCFVSVLAEGNLGAAFEEKDGEYRVISDRFLDGDCWIADVRGVKRLRLKIQPFREEDRGTVYLEKEFRAGNSVPEVYAFGGEVFVPAPVSIIRE